MTEMNYIRYIWYKVVDIESFPREGIFYSVQCKNDIFLIKP